MSNDSVAEARPKLKLALSWFVVAAGAFTGLYALGIVGSDYLPVGDDSQGWYLRWIDFIGIGLLGAGFLAGSLTAVTNPKRAGFVFLAFLPVTAFCMAYPDGLFGLARRRRLFRISGAFDRGWTDAVVLRSIRGVAVRISSP